MAQTETNPRSIPLQNPILICLFRKPYKLLSERQNQNSEIPQHIELTLFQIFIHILNNRMLGKIKKGGDKTKKQTKKEKKQTQVQETSKKQAPPTNIEDQDQNTDLVDIDYTQKQQKNKVKGAPKKKNKSELNETEVAVTNTLLQKKEEKAPMKSWVANNVQEALGKKFNVTDHLEDFQSLTNEELNKKIKQEAQLKKIENPASNNVIQGGFMFAPLEKSADQLAMEKAEKRNTLDINQTRTTNSAVTFNSINSMGTMGARPQGKNLNFINSANNTNINTVTYQKSAQEIKMEEAEKRQQELVMKKKNEGWIGTKKTQVTANQKPKVNAWVMKAQQDTGNGMKFAPIAPSKQQQKMEGSGRKEQQFIFVSKAENQERRRKREQKQKLNKEPQAAN